MSSSHESNSKFEIQNLYDCNGMVAIVTGGGSGIGLMCTQALAVNGAKVYVIGRTQPKLDTVVNTYGKGIKGELIALAGDITDKKDIARMYQEVASKEKHVDILVNNAGIVESTITTEAKTADEMKENCFNADASTIDSWCDTYRTNVPSIFFMSMCFLPLLAKATESKRGHSGCIINISSISGIVKSSQHHPGYNASKAAAIHVTKMMAFEIGNNGLKVRVNSIAPGVYPSEMTTDGSDEQQKSSIPKEKFEGKVFANRPGSETDMASGVLFIATNQYLNGQIIPIDGGYILQHGSA